MLLPLQDINNSLTPHTVHLHTVVTATVDWLQLTNERNTWNISTWGTCQDSQEQRTWRGGTRVDTCPLLAELEGGWVLWRFLHYVSDPPTSRSGPHRGEPRHSVLSFKWWMCLGLGCLVSLWDKLRGYIKCHAVFSSSLCWLWEQSTPCWPCSVTTFSPVVTCAAVGPRSRKRPEEGREIRIRHFMLQKTDGHPWKQV